MRLGGDSRWSTVAAVGALVAYGAWNVAALRASEPREFGDTYRYFGSTLWDIQNPGITPVAVYTALADPTRVVTVQVLLATLCWSVLALAAWLRLAGTWVRWAAAGAVLVMSMTAPFWSWTMLLGSESLAISSGVLWLASLVWLAGHVDRPSWPLAWTTLAAALFLVTRPQMVPVVLTVQIVCIAWAWRTARRRTATVVAVVASVATAAYAALRLQLLSADETFRYRYAINNFVDKTPSFRSYALENMPTCEPLASAVNGPRPWDDVWVLKEQLMSRCPEAFLWLGSPRASLPSWTLAIPRDTLANFLAVTPTVILEPYTSARALPGWLESLIMPSLPVWILTLAALTAGVLLAALAGARPRLSIAWLVAALGIGLSAAVMVFLIWAADGIELTRHLMPFTALGVVAAFLLPITQPGRRPRSTAD